MSLLDKLFGKPRTPKDLDAAGLSSAVSALEVLYDDPEVKSERGLSLLGPRAGEVREVGKRLHKMGGKAAMLAARDALRERHSWAIGNLEGIWASMPEWRD